MIIINENKIDSEWDRFKASVNEINKEWYYKNIIDYFNCTSDYMLLKCQIDRDKLLNIKDVDGFIKSHYNFLKMKVRFIKILFTLNKKNTDKETIRKYFPQLTCVRKGNICLKY